MSTNKRVERMQVFIGNKLIVEVENSKYGHDTGDEQGDGIDGSIYFSTGNDKTTVDFTTVTPKAGHEAPQLKAAVLGHLDVTLALFVDGNVERIDGRLKTREYDSDTKTGMVKCSWKFIGSKPEVI